MAMGGIRVSEEEEEWPAWIFLSAGMEAYPEFTKREVLILLTLVIPYLTGALAPVFFVG
jgi:hypothetical protein